jgi:hypothetical protein
LDALSSWTNERMANVSVHISMSMSKVTTPMTNTLSFDAPSMKMSMRSLSLIMSSWISSRRTQRMMTLFGSSAWSLDTKVPKTKYSYQMGKWGDPRNHCC